MFSFYFLNGPFEFSALVLISKRIGPGQTASGLAPYMLSSGCLKNPHLHATGPISFSKKATTFSSKIWPRSKFRNLEGKITDSDYFYCSTNISEIYLPHVSLQLSEVLCLLLSLLCEALSMRQYFGLVYDNCYLMVL